MNISFTTYPQPYSQSFCSRPRHIIITKEALQSLIDDEHKSVKEIAKIYNTSSQWIYEHIKKFGLQSPSTVIKKIIEQSLPLSIQEGIKADALSDTIHRSKSFIEKWSKKTLGKSPAQFRREKLVELFKSSMTDEEIAKQMDMSVVYVRQTRLQIFPSQKNPNKQARMKVVFEELAKGTGIEEIQKKHKISKCTIMRYKQEYKKLNKSV